MKHRTRSSGFTLIELMTVMVILSILASIAIPNFLNAISRAQMARVVSDQELILWALETYSLDNDDYPRNWVTGTASPPDLVPLTTPFAYLSYLPSDAFLMSSNEKAKDVINKRSKYMGYSYVNFLQMNNGERLPLAPYGLRGSANYGMTSVSPLIEENLMWPAEQILTIYNPSNGLLSAGIIVTFGP